MSLGIVFKGAEGIVLAADSRVTLFAQIPAPAPAAPAPAAPVGNPTVLVPATFDNATKLLQLPSQRFVAAVTYGAGAIGTTAPRTASSFIPELEAELVTANVGRLTVQAFAQRISDFFMTQWTTGGMPNPLPPGQQDMVFQVAGYDDETAPYGRLFEVFVPSRPVPNELIPNDFGVSWGGQREITDRILQGFDSTLPNQVFDILNTPTAQRTAILEQQLRNRLQVRIPYQFLPLQDCVDLSIFIVRTTIEIQRWIVGVRGVGGAIDVGTITRTEGFKAIQIKQITGEDYPFNVRE